MKIGMKSFYFLQNDHMGIYFSTTPLKFEQALFADKNNIRMSMSDSEKWILLTNKDILSYHL